MSAQLTSIDIEPGGLDSPVGYIGISHVVDECAEEPRLYRFMRPDIPYSWDDWCAHRRVQAWQGWMKLSEGEREELRWIGADVLIECDPGLRELLDGESCHRFTPESMREEPLPFTQVWPTVRDELGMGYVAAYGARYDRARLRELLGIAGLPQPRLRWLDGMEAIRHLTPRRIDDAGHDTDVDFAIRVFTEGGNTLGAQAVRHGLIDAETTARRWALHVTLGIGNKATAWDAGEDARLNALIFQRLIERHGCIDAAIDELALHVKDHLATGVETVIENEERGR